MRLTKLNKIFLSAGIPHIEPGRNPKYFETADIIAIRDSVRALATVVIPKAHLVWGGHPSITPLIRQIMETMHADVREHVTLYQSRYFEKHFPEDNFAFEQVILTDRKDSLAESLEFMREKMIGESDFKAAVFIGGMENVEREFKMFNEIHPQALSLPVASTGGAAKVIFENGINGEIDNFMFDHRLFTEYAYMSLFTDLLTPII